MFAQKNTGKLSCKYNRESLLSHTAGFSACLLSSVLPVGVRRAGGRVGGCWERSALHIHAGPLPSAPQENSPFFVNVTPKVEPQAWSVPPRGCERGAQWSPEAPWPSTVFPQALPLAGRSLEPPTQGVAMAFLVRAPHTVQVLVLPQRPPLPRSHTPQISRNPTG